MKYAILSDIHANLEALSVVLEKCRAVGVTHYVCLGDVVGYNADPKACLALLRSLNPVAVVKGNHDEYISNSDEVMEGFNAHARDAVLWSKKQLSDDEKKYLASLPMKQVIRGTPITVVHATLDSPSEWGYIFDVHHAADNFSYQFTQLCFCGHSHVPIAFVKRPVTSRNEPQITQIAEWSWKPEEFNSGYRIAEEDEIVIPIEPACKYLINVGSVGQPRNRDPRASFAVYDSEEKIVTRYRIPYDVATTQDKIRAAGLPERLAVRLEVGN